MRPPSPPELARAAAATSGTAEGSIIAAIMTVQIPMKDGKALSSPPAMSIRFMRPTTMIQATVATAMVAAAGATARRPAAGIFNTSDPRVRSAWLGLRVAEAGTPIRAPTLGSAVEDAPHRPHEVDMAPTLAWLSRRKEQLAAPEVMDLVSTADEDGGDRILPS